MSRWRPHGRTLEEWIGFAILLPFRVALLIFVLLLGVATLPVTYPLGIVFVLVKAELPLRERIKAAFLWPVYLVGGILFLNEFLGLGGFNSPYLSRFTEWLSSLNRRNPRPSGVGPQGE